MLLRSGFSRAEVGVKDATLMFRSADLVLVNNVDLLEHLDVVNPGVERVL